MRRRNARSAVRALPLVGLLGAGFGLLACGSPPNDAIDVSPPAASSSGAGVACPTTPAPQGRGPVAVVDYADFLHFRGHDYLLNKRMHKEPKFVGSQIGTVRCRIGELDPEAYRLRNGYATYLSAGTPIFAIKDRPASKHVAVRLRDGSLQVYSAQ